MAPDKIDPESGDDTPNTSTVSIENNTTPVSENEREPYFEPVVHLPEVQVRTNEEEEEQMLRLRCKLFRYHNQESPAEWKERGTGDVKILHHNEKSAIRILMRQDKTLKIRANHYITPFMELKPNCNSDRAFVWSSRADFADEETKQETFAIRFANVDHAKLFKDKFDEARGIVTVAIVKGKEEEEEEEEDEQKAKEEKDKDGEDTPSKEEEEKKKEEEEEGSKEDVVEGLAHLSVREKEEQVTSAEESPTVTTTPPSTTPSLPQETQ